MFIIVFGAICYTLLAEDNVLKEDLNYVLFVFICVPAAECDNVILYCN